MLQTKRMASESDELAHSRGNRRQRRAAVIAHRKKRQRHELVALAVETLAKLVAQDETISGAAVILADGEVQFHAADPFRRGGTA
jgi:hypothetical protein